MANIPKGRIATTVLLAIDGSRSALVDVEKLDLGELAGLPMDAPETED